MQFGLITLKFMAGKFENTVIDGRCSNFTAFSLTSDAIAKISEVGLNFMLEMGVTKFKTIFSGVGFALDQHDFRLYILTTPESDPLDKYWLFLEIAIEVPEKEK